MLEEGRAGVIYTEHPHLTWEHVSDQVYRIESGEYQHIARRLRSLYPTQNSRLRSQRNPPLSHHNLCWVSLDEHRPVSSFTYLNYSLCQRILPACIGHFVFMSSSPDIHDHFDILDEVHDIATRWKPFGAALRLPMPVLDRIETDRRDARSCLSEVVTEWL